MSGADRCAILREHPSGRIYDDKVGNAISRKIKGGRLSTRAKSSDQKQVEVDLAAESVSGDLLNNRKQLLLKATEVNHDVMPMFVKGRVINLLR